MIYSEFTIILLLCVNFVVLSNGKIEECAALLSRYFCIRDLNGIVPVDDSNNGFIGFNQFITKKAFYRGNSLKSELTIPVHSIFLSIDGELLPQPLAIYSIDGQRKIAVESKVPQKYKAEKLSEAFIFIKAKAYPDLCIIVAYNLASENISDLEDINDVGILYVFEDQLLVSSPTNKPQSITQMLWKVEYTGYTCYDSKPVPIMKNMQTTMKNPKSSKFKSEAADIGNTIVYDNTTLKHKKKRKKCLRGKHMRKR